MKFADFPGYEATKQSLIQAARAGRVAHARLFSASEGGFGLMMALAYAQFLNCENQQEDDSCGNCPSCLKSSRFIHPDFHYLFPIAKTKKIDTDELSPHLPAFRSFMESQPWGGLHEWIESAGFENRTPIINVKAVRECIRNLQLKAFEARYKIQIIWLPESMKNEGANALLKILEEPAPFTVFLVVSQEADNLLPTLLSRMQRINMGSPGEEELHIFLERKFPAGKDLIRMAVSLSEGSITAAIRMLEEKPDDYHPWYMEWQRACYRRDGAQILRMAEEFHEMSRDLQKLLLQYSLNKTRKALVLAAGPPEILHLQENEQKELPNLGKILQPEMAEQILGEIDRAWYHIDRNASSRMVFFDTSMAISDAYKMKPAG